MRILSIIGSMNGSNSREYNVITKLLSAEQYKNDEIVIFTAASLDIKFCLGCTSCFRTGLCELDATDDMKKIKEHLLNADLVIISSPVYMHSISGFMKSLLDRLAYWSHTFHLIGKRFVICTSTGNSGSEYVVSYLKKVVSAFGGVVIGEISVDDKMTDEKLKEKLNDINSTIQKSTTSHADYKPTTFQHTLYKGLRETLIENSGYEHDYWLEHDMFNFATFKDYLLYKLNSDNKSNKL